MIVAGAEKGRDSDYPIGAGSVFHDDGLSPALGKSLRKEARAKICAAPGGHGRNQSDRTMRPVDGANSGTRAGDGAQEYTDTDEATDNLDGTLLQPLPLARFWFSTTRSGANIFFIRLNNARYQIDQELTICRFEAR